MGVMIGAVARKRCCSCDRDLPATVDYFYRNASAADGLRYDCKRCAVQATRDYRARRKLNGGRPFGRGMGKPHVCTGPCGRTLLWTTEHYYVNKRGEDGEIRALYPKCKDCTKAKTKERRYRDYAKVRARERELRAVRMADPDFAAAQRKYWETHRAKVKASPRLLSREREARRMSMRLRAEREGRPFAESDEALRGELGGYLPAAPLAAAIRRWIAGVEDGTQEDAAAACGVDERTIYGWLAGSYEQVRLDAADRALIGLDKLWFDVWDPDVYPRAAELFEGSAAVA